MLFRSNEHDNDESYYDDGYYDDETGYEDYQEGYDDWQDWTYNEEWTEQQQPAPDATSSTPTTQTQHPTPSQSVTAVLHNATYTAKAVGDTPQPKHMTYYEQMMYIGENPLSVNNYKKHEGFMVDSGAQVCVCQKDHATNCL